MESADKVKKIFQILEKNNQTLCLAESCTGGLISSALTDFPGASRFFLGSVIAYTNNVKVRQLNIPQSTLDQYGAVSKETAENMARGVKSLLQADWSLSITGLMGPEGDLSRKPIGAIFITVCGNNSLNTQNKIVSGSNRREKKYNAVLLSLDYLLVNLGK